VNPKTNRVYVSQDTSTGSRLWAFDGVNHTPVGTLGLGVRPTAIAADTARNRVYVAANKCYFDPQRIALFCEPILGLLMIALDGNSLAVIDTVSDSAQGRGAAYNPATDRIYVAVSSGGPFDTVKVIDAATFQVIDSIEVGSGAFGVAVNPVTNRVYVTNESDGTMSVLDGASNTVISTVFLGFQTFPEGIGVDPTTNRIYVSHAGVGVMRVIDGVTNTEIGQIFVGGFSTDAQPNPVTGRFYVPVYQNGVVKAFRYQ
jgi:YVTN family beta-propeller protein